MNLSLHVDVLAHETIDGGSKGRVLCMASRLLGIQLK